MTIRNLMLASAAFALLTFSAAPALAAQCNMPGGFPAFIAQMKKEAAGKGVSAKGLSALDGLTLDDAVLAADRKQHVFNQTFEQFSGRMISQDRLTKGARHMQTHGATLKRLGYAGLYTLQPNTGAILQLFGDYRGTSRVPGLRFTNPFYSNKKISLRARNLNGDRLKVNDRRGNPIEIAAVVVWRVEDTAKAAFDVDDYEQYVKIQSEAAVRHLASSFAYDEDETSGAPVGPLSFIARRPAAIRAT